MTGVDWLLATLALFAILLAGAHYWWVARQHEWRLWADEEIMKFMKDVELGNMNPKVAMYEARRLLRKYDTKQ